MKELTGYEKAPDRSIWSALMNAADLPRLGRMLKEARLMMAKMRLASPDEARLFRDSDGVWGDLVKVIEAENEKRRIFGHSDKFIPAVGEKVIALGQVGEFEVTEVDVGTRSVNLRLVDFEFRATNIPWLVLQRA